jgi:hypothetical protein
MHKKENYVLNCESRTNIEKAEKLIFSLHVKIPGWVGRGVG